MNSQHLNSDHAQRPSSLIIQTHSSSSGRPTDRRSAPVSGPLSAQQPRPIFKGDSDSASRQRRREQRRSRRNRNSSSSAHNSLSAHPVVVHQTPSPTSPVNSINDQDRYFPTPSKQPPRYHGRDSLEQTSVVHFDEAQLAMFAADNAARMASISIKDELTLAAGKVTPGVDDTPYIQYALQALGGPAGTPMPLDAASEEYPPRRVGREEMEYQQMSHPPSARKGAPHSADHSAYPSTRDAQADPTTPRDSESIPRPTQSLLNPNIASSPWVPVTDNMRQDIDRQSKTYQPLTFKPRILRPISMIAFTILCLLMTIALIFTAVYSNARNGLTPYPGSIYSGEYFVFRILPPLLAGVIFIYAQCIYAASLRILPFTAMSSEDSRDRFMALFQDLYATTILLPTWVGPWQFKSFSLATWLAIFTIPLHNSAFACIYVEERWIWASVQGVVWTLVVLYLGLVLSSAVLTIYWLRRWTGLIWDVRSIGDLLPLLNRSNGMESYRRSHLAEKSADLKAQLHERWFDRLGYWRAEESATGGIWYAIGASSNEGDPKAPTSSMGKKASNEVSMDGGESDDGRAKYLPWCLRDSPIIGFTAVATLLLLALLIVSFLPSTRLESGFFAGTTAKPNGSAFSGANFIFSFVPSLIGMMLFLLIQGIDRALRILEPWGELCEANGSPAHMSLMADYAACLPLQSTWRAAKNGHWRVAAVSLLTAVSIFIPILGGGFLMALTGPDDKVRMYPSMPVFGVLVALLFLYVGGLSLAIPRRRRLMLPRGVTTIGDIISLCASRELTEDAAFRSVRSREDLERRLGLGGEGEESAWLLSAMQGERGWSVQRVKGNEK